MATFLINSRSFKYQLKNGETFASNPSDVTLNLAGNILEKVQTDYTVQIGWAFYADSINTMPCIGVCVAVGKVLTHGVFRDDSGLVLTAASPVFVSDASAMITTLAPSGVGDVVQIVGIAINTDEIFVNPSLDWVIRQ